jgi:xanthine dehydrogenase accessory factor
MNELLACLRDALSRGEPIVWVSVIDLAATVPRAGAVVAESDGAAPLRLGATLVVRPGERSLGTTGDARLDEAATRDALALLDPGASDVRTYRTGPRGVEVSVFHHVFVPPARMIIIGGTDVAAALARVARHLGYRVAVCDARPAFATARRFPDADEVVVDWPDRYLASLRRPLGPRDAVCVLSHDHKFDVPALAAAVATSAGYVGAMGSRGTQARRIERLRAEGIAEEQLARVMGPIGIDIGARSPEETAIAIVAEIIALRARRPVRSLRDATGPIHGPA